MYTFYYSPAACSMSVHFLLTELGVKFDAVKVDIQNGEGQTEEFKKLNPLGQIPLLVVDGTPISEGAAQIVYLCDTHKSPWLPSSGIARATALKWLMWGNASLHPAFGKLFWLRKNGVTEGELFTSAAAGIQKLFDQAEAQLNKTTYLCGDEPTMGDVLLTVMANWLNWFPEGMCTLGAKTKALCTTIQNLPSYRKAMETEATEYKLAA